ncbi:MAG: DMT family transporter [Eubacterium sp.]|nr:DMT family transporter [Candidatus Colimonas fimequi]
MAKIKTKDKKAQAHFLMCFILFAWAIEYILAKPLLVYFTSANLMLFKYLIVLVIMGALKVILEPGFTFKFRDLLAYMAAAFFGVAFYYYCEWEAMEYIPVASVTVMLALMPAVSVTGEKLLYKRPITKLMIVGMIITVIGVIMVLGINPKELLDGNLRGYALAFGAVVGWTICNFCGSNTTQRYSNIDYGFYLVIIALVFVLCMNFNHMPQLSVITPRIAGQILLLGCLCGVVNFLILPSGLRELGPTVTGVFSFLVPFACAVLALIFVGESLGPVQIVGAVIVVASSCLIIYEKGRVS